MPTGTDMDYTALSLLRQNHPAWRMLCSEHAPLLASFLHRVFIAPNVHTIAQAELAEALEDEHMRMGPNVRLEQELIGYGWLQRRLDEL